MPPPRQRVPVTPQMTQPQPWATQGAAHLPFGVDFQGMLLRVLLDDPSFARSISQHIAPHFFQNEAMSWAWASSLTYQKERGHFPTFHWVLDALRNLDHGKQQLFRVVLESAREKPVTDELWLRERTIDFVKRSIFRQAF
jgi:hypothetical protein